MYPIDNIYASVYILDMNTTTQQMTGSEIIEALRSGKMTQAQVVELMKQRAAAYETDRMNRPSILNKVPSGGWTDADRVAK
jgi:hypothetical protein